MNFGIPYQGSKSSIASDIIGFLPSGKRLVDLFGGGGAISHCGASSGKWGGVLCSDNNPLLKPLLEKAMSGFYNYENFTPEFVTREEFHDKKNKDGYIKWIYSFSNDGRTYLFGKHIEKDKEQLHNKVVFGTDCTELESRLGFDINLKETGIKARRLELKKLLRANNKRIDLEQLQQLERLQTLHGTTFDITTQSYLDYVHEDGDVVYCDIPYEGTGKCYGGGFNHAEFYAWVKSRPYKVYFSSYDITALGLEVVWEKQKQVRMCADKTNTLYKMEKIYCAAR